jgi:hypothetical protein
MCARMGLAIVSTDTTGLICYVSCPVIRRLLHVGVHNVNNLPYISCLLYVRFRIFACIREASTIMKRLDL